jgi:hydroxymethylpyrimidine pyrophosphatase-like HAD family hydrolase
VQDGAPPTLVRSSPRFLELLPDGAGKGAMFMEALALLGVAPSRAAAFGDEHNDMDMLRAAGHSFAMAGAPAAVRAAALRTIDGNDTDAIALAVDELLDN